jgi:diacylglycerol kinase
MKKQLVRFSHPLRGLWHAVRYDRSFKSQFFGGFVALCVVWLIFQPLAPWEWLFIILAWNIVLITELQNSALEEALDHIHPERHSRIGLSKDMAAGSVLLSGFFCVCTVVALALTRLVA